MRATSLDQPLEGIKAFASLAGGAIVLYVVYSFAGVFLDGARTNAPGGFGGVQANDWLTTGLDIVLPAMFVGMVFFGLIASAVYARRYA